MLNLWDKWSIEWHDWSQVRFRRMASQNSNRRRICAMFNTLDSKVSSSGWVIMLWSWERLYVKRSINTASCWRLETRISSHGTVFLWQNRSQVYFDCSTGLLSLFQKFILKTILIKHWVELWLIRWDIFSMVVINWKLKFLEESYLYVRSQ